MEYHRLKNMTISTNNNNTLSTPITRNKLSFSHKKDVIKISILNMMSTEFQNYHSLQAEIISSLKSLKDKSNIRMKDVGTSTHVNVEDVATTTEVSQPTNHREKIVADVAVMTVPPVAPQKPDAGASSSSYADDVDARTGPKDPPPFGFPGTFSDPKKDILLGKDTSRTLFLTDSILKGVNQNALRTRRRERFVKKIMYYLTDISNYEPEFGYSDTVIISAGINDLTRKRMLPQYLCDIVVPYFRKISAKYPNTRFIVNSTILSSSRQLNGFILTLDKYIEESLSKLPNFHFFNSHRVMCEYDNKGHKVYTDMDRFGVGVHISDRDVRYISDSLYTFLRSGCHHNRLCHYNEIHRSRYQT